MIAAGERCSYPRCRALADTVDHHPALDAHEHVINDPDCCTYRPMCKPHNSKLGAMHVNQKRAQRKALTTANKHAAVNAYASTMTGNIRPAKALQPASSRAKPLLSLEPNDQHPAASSSPSLAKKSPSRAKALHIVKDPAECGGDQPRLATPIPGGSSTYGIQVAWWAKRWMGVTLMPWQVNAIARQLAHRQDVLVHSESLTSVARQQGKTVALMALIGWWLTEMPVIRGRAQSVLSAAHVLGTAESVFLALLPFLEAWAAAQGATGVRTRAAGASTWSCRTARPGARACIEQGGRALHEQRSHRPG